MADVQLLVRVNPKIRRALEKIRREEGVSLKFMAIEAFSQWLERRDRDIAPTE